MAEEQIEQTTQETTTDTGAVTQEQLDSAPDYDKASGSEYSQSQNEIKAPAKTDDKGQTPEPKYEFEHNGKKVTGTIQQILKWAQMGYDRPQWQQNFNKTQQAWNQEKQQWEKQWGQYKEIDQYAKQNPQWWDHVSQSWKTRGQAPAAQTPGTQTPGQGAPSPEVAQLKQELAALKQEIMTPVQSFLSERQQEKNKAEDDQLDQEIKSIQEKYKDLDWTNPDENGKSLEYRVLEHAQNNGIKSFQTAFRDLLHDQLVARAEQQAKLNVANGVQKNSRLGILGKSPTPKTPGLQPPNPKDIRKQTYDSYDDEILQDLKSRGISLTGRT